VLLSSVCACTAANPAFESPSPPVPDAGEAPVDAAARTDRGAPSLDETPPIDAAMLDDQAAGAAPPDAATAVPDRSPDRAPPGVALLVVGDTTLAMTDVQLEASLTKLGFVVLVEDGQASVSADAAGTALVVISGSAWSDDVGAKFRDVPVPVVVFDDAVFGPMKMTGTRQNIDFGSVAGDRRLMITDDSQALAGGLSGLVTVASANLEISWGVPASTAIKVATVLDQSNRFTIFAYPEGSAMVGMVAPARRVGSFVRFPETASFTESGLMLFEAAARWATASPE
jgi:hypothetical protein